MNSKFHVLDYSNSTQAGLKPLMLAIKSVDGDVMKLEPADAARSKDGVATKTFSLINHNGQAIELQVNESGELPGAKLNKKVYPAGSPTNLHDMAQKIVNAFKTNTTVYANSLAKKLARAARAEISVTNKSFKPTSMPTVLAVIGSDAGSNSLRQDTKYRSVASLEMVTVELWSNIQRLCTKTVSTPLPPSSVWVS